MARLPITNSLTQQYVLDGGHEEDRLANLAAGLAREDILRSYPGLTPEAIQAALAYAAELARDRVIALPA